MPGDTIMDGYRNAEGQAVYEIGGQQHDLTTPGFAEAVARAHATQQRPRCLCKPGGIEMYVARRGDHYVVKRMPGTGSIHRPDCQSFELAPDATGLNQLLGAAILEEVETGRTTLRLDFSMSKRAGQPRQVRAGSARGSANGINTRLSLKGLLHYLWDQAELTRWHRGFEGKRSWGAVRHHLIQAVDGKYTCGEALDSRLYVPEPFSTKTLVDTEARRLATWAKAKDRPGGLQPLLLLVAEAKRIEPSRFGHRLVVKHLPDAAFRIEAPLFSALARHFTEELALWDTSDSVRMVVAATFHLSTADLPKVSELCLMPVTREWLPITSFPEYRLISQLVADRRAFIKVLHYGPKNNIDMASVVLTDVGETPFPVFLNSLAEES